MSVPDFSEYVSDSSGDSSSESDSEIELKKQQVVNCDGAIASIQFPTSLLVDFTTRGGERRLVLSDTLQCCVKASLDDSDSEGGDEDHLSTQLGDLGVGQQSKSDGMEQSAHKTHKRLSQVLKGGLKNTKKLLNNMRSRSASSSASNTSASNVHQHSGSPQNLYGSAQVYLMDDCLLLTEDIEGVQKGVFAMSLMDMDRPFVDVCEQLSFSVASEGNAIFFLAADEEQKVKWIQSIVQVLKESVAKSVLSKSRGWFHRIKRGTLWSEAMDGNLDRLKTVVDSVEDVNAQDESGATALHYAAFTGQGNVVRYLISRGAQPNTLDNQLMSPLHYTALKGMTDCATALLDGNADPDMRDLQDRTALFVAVATASVSSQYNIGLYITALGARGASTEITDVAGDTALHMAVGADYVEGVESLLSTGANIEALSTGERTALHCVCAREKPHCKIIHTLLTHGANPNAVDEQLNTPLHLLLRGDTAIGSEQQNIPKPFPPMTTERVQGSILVAGYGGRVDLANAEGLTSSVIAAKQNLNLTDAVEQWRTRTEPKESISRLIKASVFRLPFATGPGHANWAADNSTDTCKGCRGAFSFTRRKHHCRRCGQIYCSACCSKSFTLCPRQESQDVQPVSAKVCTTCFNSLYQVVEQSAKSLPASRASSMEFQGAALDKMLNTEDTQRSALFGTRVSKDETSSAQVVVEKRESAVSSTLSATTQAKQKLVERGEKLERLAGKSEGMQKGAANFADAARKLREQQENKGGWFGGLF